MNRRPDIAANRQAVKYGRLEQLQRVLWLLLGKPLFRLSPRPAFGWRRWILRLFGASVGHDVEIYSTAVVEMPWKLEVGAWSSIGERAILYNLGPITIGERVTISQRAHLCAGTHDYEDPALPLLKPPILIADSVWIAAEAFVGPGVKVQEGAVVGARSVVVKDVEAWTVVVGNPARAIKERSLGRGT